MLDSSSIVRIPRSLTEDEVKQRFVPFLKVFYQNRYEPMQKSMSVALDNVSKDGQVVADGMISFRKSDGTPFVCTYEATSRDKAMEVKFQTNLHYLRWDCLAFALVWSAVVYAYLYLTDLVWLVERKFIGNLGIVLGTGIVAFLSWYFVMKGWRKYRYIYAIQQFKQYHADEQWIAIAEDVFLSPNDPYMVELRNQCIYHGIGLAIVPAEGEVRKLVDPSRLGIFGKDRKMVQWVTRAVWYQAFSQNVSQMAAHRPKLPNVLTVWWNKIGRPLRYLLLDPVKKSYRRWLSGSVDDASAMYARFMSAQSVQKWVALMAGLTLVMLFYQVTTFREARVLELKELQLRDSLGRNPEDYIRPQIKDEIIPYDGNPTGVPKQFNVRKDQKFKAEIEEEGGNVINLSGDDD